MKSKEKMVLSTEKKSKTSTDIPKQSRKLNSSSTTKKCVKKELKEKILMSLAHKSEDFNDSSDFISPLSKWKPLKNEKSLSKPSTADSRRSKKQTNPRSLSSSSAEPAPPSAVTTPLRRRTRSSEKKIQKEEEEGEKHGESITDYSDLSKSTPVLPSISKATVKGYSASKPTGKGSSQESKKQQTPPAPKLSKVKAEPPGKDEKPRRAPVKKTAKSETVEINVKPSSSTGKGDKIPDKGDPPNKRRTYRPRSKSSENLDTLNLSEKSSPKLDTPVRKQTRKENSDSSKTPIKPSGKKTQSSPRQDRTPTKNKDPERNMCEFIDSSPILGSAEKRRSPNVQSPTGSKKMNNDNSPVNSSQISTVKCPTCKELIPEEGLGRHILMCLKNKYKAGTKSHVPASPNREQLCKDEILARKIHEDMNRDMLSSKESVTAEDLNLCHICQKDLSHMNNVWKTRHINQCFDKSDEENARKKKKLSASLRQQVLACPMCGKQFKTGALRRCHLKKCAQELSVPPEKALQLIADQEKNFKESQLVLAPDAVAATSSSSVRSLHKKSNKQPDEQMQIAMALSSSLFDEEKKLNDQLTETVKNIHQGVNRELKKLKKSQKKGPSESVPLLLTVSKEDQLARNAQRVDSIISEHAHTVHFTRQFPNSSLSLSSGDVYQTTENSNNSISTPPFWSRASLTDSSQAPKLFYVQSLMPPIQVDTVTVGSRLKPMSAIPGRGLDKEETDSVSDNPVDAPAEPLTQTAVLLAEMAQSNEEDFDDEESSSSIIEQTQGFYLPPAADDTPSTSGNEAMITLSKDICSLLNKPHLSDVELITADNSVVFAHRLILSVRCPLILNLAVSRGDCLIIEMKDVPHNSLLAFFKYIYGGQVDFEKSVTADLLTLARKFNVSQLALICEKLLRSFIDDVCYTSSVESIAGDVPKPLEIDEDPLTENDDDGMAFNDGMASDCHSNEPHEDDILSGIKEPSVEKLCSLPGASPLKSSHGSVSNFSPRNNNMERRTVVPAEISKTIMEHSDMEVSPKNQSKRKVPIPVCDDDSISVIEPVTRLVNEIPLSSTDAPSCLDPGYKNSVSTDLELGEEIADKSNSSDIIQEPNISSFTPPVAVFQEEPKEKETSDLVFSDNASDEKPTSFRGLLPGENLDARSTEVDCLSPNMSQDPGFTDIPSVSNSPQDQNRSNNALSPMHYQQEEKELCKENSLNQNSTPRALSDYEFDDSNELFSESEDLGAGGGGGESENVGVSTVNSPKLETRIDPMDDSIEISNDSICFVSENQQNIHGPGMTFMALHLADTLCENSADEDPVSRNAPIKTASPVTRPQVLNSNSNALNGRTASFHMADTILEVSKTVKDSSESPRMTAGSPLSTTVFEELTKVVTLVQRSLSESGSASTNNLKKFSPSSLLNRFDSSEPNFRTDSDSELDAKEMSYESPTFPRSSLLQLSGESKVKNLVSKPEDSSDVLSRSQRKKKRKTCSRESSPLAKRSLHGRTDIYHMGSETAKSGLNDYNLGGICFSKATSSESSPFKKNNVKSTVLDLVCAGSLSSSESTEIISDPTRKLLNKNRTNDIEEWLEIADSSQCDVRVLSSNSPRSTLDKNRDAFSRLSEDSLGEDRLDECSKTNVPLETERDSDLEVEPDSENGASFGASLERNPDSLPGSSNIATPERPKKKFTFKRTQLKNIKSPIFRATPHPSSPPAGHTSGHDREHSTPSFHLQFSSKDLAQSSARVESDSESQHNVWDDFEDNGHIEEFVVLSSPEQHNMSPAEPIGAERLDCKDSSNSDSPRTLEGSDEAANNDAFNSSFINDFMCSSSPMMSQMEDSPHLGDLQQSPTHIPLFQKNFGSSSGIAKTPLMAIKRAARKQPMVPSPFTPMPLFTQMSTPELKNEMKKRGCKQMSRKKMITVLQDIYQKTHQYETDSEFDQSALHSEATPRIKPGHLDNVRLQTRSKTHNEKLTPLTAKTVSKKNNSKISKKAKSSSESNTVLAHASSSDSEVTNLVDSASEKHNVVGQYEESFMANEDDILGSQQQASSSCDNLNDKLRELVLKSPEIYTKMLLYEPVDFDQLKKKISESKIKCAAGKLLGFLDNQCITFAMHKEKQHHGTWKPRVPKK